jgi:hypothetical protein
MRSRWVFAQNLLFSARSCRMAGIFANSAFWHQFLQNTILLDVFTGGVFDNKHQQGDIQAKR